MYQVDLNLLVGVMTFTFSPLHCFYATIVEGGAADRRRRPILVRIYIYVSWEPADARYKKRAYTSLRTYVAHNTYPTLAHT